MKRALLLGSGASRERKIRATPLEPRDFKDYELVTIDMDPDCSPTIIGELPGALPSTWGPVFDEIHAYDSLEHWGTQGDWKGWLDEMGKYHDLLKPGGRFFCIIPVGEDRFTDPGHTRFMGSNWFNILCNDYYEERAAKDPNRKTAQGDYRWYWKKNFQRIAMEFVGDPPHHMAIILEKA